MSFYLPNCTKLSLDSRFVRPARLKWPFTVCGISLQGQLAQFSFTLPAWPASAVQQPPDCFHPWHCLHQQPCLVDCCRSVAAAEHCCSMIHLHLLAIELRWRHSSFITTAPGSNSVVVAIVTNVTLKACSCSGHSWTLDWDDSYPKALQLHSEGCQARSHRPSSVHSTGLLTGDPGRPRSAVRRPLADSTWMHCWLPAGGDYGDARLLRHWPSAIRLASISQRYRQLDCSTSLLAGRPWAVKTCAGGRLIKLVAMPGLRLHCSHCCLGVAVAVTVGWDNC